MIENEKTTEGSGGQQAIVSSDFTTTPPPLSTTNQFEQAAAARGSLTPAQEQFLAKQNRDTLASARRETGISKPITRLSKRAAWLLIRAIKAQGAENG